MTTLQAERTTDEEWLTASAAARLAGQSIHAYHVQRWARSGLVAVREYPGSYTRYRAADVMRIIAGSTRTANVSA